MNKLKKILTMEDLVNFCAEEKLKTFDSKETGYQLSVHIPATFETTEVEDPTLLYAYVKLFHIGENRNHSSVTKEAAEKSLEGIKYKPVLANFTSDTPDGEMDFTSHDMEIDDDGNIVYIEKQVGCFTADEPYIKYDDETEKEFVYAKIAIPREYTPASEILERKNGTKISVELIVNSMEYNGKEKVLELTDITVSGATLLGYDPRRQEEVEEGMKGAKVSLQDFSVESNSLFSHTEINQQLIETLDKLNITLSQCFNNKNQKGGMESMKLEELLAKYSKTVEDLDFDYQNMTDEELEAKFAELFDVAEGSEDTSTDEAGDSEETEEVAIEEEQEEAVIEPEVKEENAEEEKTEEYTKKFSVEVNGRTASFEISLSEQIYALEDLVNATYGDADNTYYNVKAYSDYIVMIDWWNGHAFKQSYKSESDTFALVGDRVRVFANWLTAEEEESLKEMRANYSVVQDKLAAYEKAEVDAEKEAIFAAEAYAEFLETEEFKTLINNKDAYSVDELKDKAEIAFAKCVKANGTFSMRKEEKKQIKHSLFSTKENKDKQPYGNLFSN